MPDSLRIAQSAEAKVGINRFIDELDLDAELSHCADAIKDQLRQLADAWLTLIEAASKEAPMPAPSADVLLGYIKIDATTTEGETHQTPRGVQATIRDALEQLRKP